MSHAIPARSKLLPPIPITDRQFVYRRAGDTDVRDTFAHARAAFAEDKQPTPAPAPVQLARSAR